MPSGALRAIVTAGGTSEPIDAVRFVGNSSTGRFGRAIALELWRRGIHTTILGSPAVAKLGLPSGIRFLPFVSFADLQALLGGVLNEKCHLLFMAAAIADFSPAQRSGKISSKRATLELSLRRTPKLLATLRGMCGPRTILVGFKLLAGASREELQAAAREQMAASRLDFTVANDVQELGERRHPIFLHSRHESPVFLDGTREQVAESLVSGVLAELLRRVDRASREAPVEEELLDFGIAAFDLPTQKTKSASLDFCQSLRGSLPGSPAIAVFNGGLALPLPGARGRRVAAEAPAVVDALIAGGPATTPYYFSLSMQRGCLLVVPELAWPRIAAELQSLRDDFFASLARAGDPSRREDWELAPILDAGQVVGLIGRERSLDLSTPHWKKVPVDGDLLDRFLEGTQDAKLRLMPGDPLLAACEPLGWSHARGKDAWISLRSPTLSRDLIPAASICLFDPWHRRVLIGERLVAPCKGFFALPGGTLKAGETALEAARRELAEETGLRAAGSPLWRTTIFAACGGRRFRVDNFYFGVSAQPTPRPTTGMRCRWLDLAQEMTPLTAGTRRILRELRHRLSRWKLGEGETMGLAIEKP